MWNTSAGKFGRMQQGIIDDTDIIRMTEMFFTGEWNIHCLPFVDHERIWLAFFRMFAPGSIVDIIGKVMKDQISLLCMNLTDISARL